MTYEEAKLAMPSASRVIEVLEKISRKIKLGIRVKVEKWKWRPKIGEFCIEKESKKLVLIWAYNDWKWVEKKYKQKQHDTICYIRLPDEQDVEAWPEEVIPILDWQEIERILERLGYYVRVLRNVDKDDYGNHLCECAIDRNRGHIAKAVAKTCQQAVTLALLELEKELK